MNVADNSIKCHILVNVFFFGGGGGVGCLTSNKLIDFGADPDHDSDTEIFNGMFETPGYVQF